MNEDQFSSMLALITPPVIEKIVRNSNLDTATAIVLFYQSNLWHYGPMTLYTMFQDEVLTGRYDYPEEA